MNLSVLAKNTGFFCLVIFKIKNKAIWLSLNLAFEMLYIFIDGKKAFIPI